MTIINTIRTKMSDSLILTIIYTLGHFIIAVLCVTMITGASLELATIDAIIEPLINAVWFYVLHKIYTKFKSKKTKISL
ncbi:MAG: hypothetical protein CMG47_01650 [Candidatus Marinimicrobia bacterium]|nr:hypothetical protein [Candidatus Neomarinimicrobiota bacterium]|tara:strand:+ start:710 stop:946 length:237 start_codon:yes stop_codon:yes gene_type:complete